jgi:SAM-dependent methyltransferase
VPVALFLSQFFTVTGIDFSPEQIRRARASVPQVTFLCQDMTALAFAAESFDAICSYYAIIHIPRQEHRGILYTFHRLLKPGGLALLCLGAGDLEADVDENYFGTRMYWSHYDAETNLRLLQERGFQIIWAKRVADTSFPGADHLFVLAQKPQ